MIRFSAVTACIFCAALASTAQAQSYPAQGQPYPAYGGGMQPPAYGYGPQGGLDPRMMPPGSMMPPNMDPRLMPPSMAMDARMMGGAGGPGRYSGQGPGPGQMMQPGMEPGMQGPGMAGAMNVAPGRYRVPSGSPPPMKLPKGVTAENGLLYYNGAPYAEGAAQAPLNPYMQAAYQESVPDGSQGAPTTQPNGNVGYSMGGCENGNCNGNCGNGNCNDCGPGCFGSIFGHHGCFASIFGYPGKLGCVWTAGVEVLGMTRDNSTSRVIVQNTDTLDTVFNSETLDFDWEAGGRGRLKFMGSSGIAIEGVYMKMGTFRAEDSVDGNNDLQIPFPLAGVLTDFFGADEMNLSYTSSIQSAEFNVIYPFGNFQLLGGYRYFGIDETFGISSRDDDDGDTSIYDTSVFNNLNGGQIGILGQWQLFGLLNFDFDAKFGVFGNAVTQRQIVRDLDNSVVVRNTNGAGDGTSYVTELGIRAVVPLGATFNVTCGYNVFFIDRVALAPDQLDFSNNANSGTQVNKTGDIVMQGVTLGLNARW